MRKLIPPILLLLALMPARAFALNTNDLLSTIAMPLAVAAVSNIAHVPPDQLATLVSTLNQANVPPAQFVEVVRYVPVALVDQNGQPFVAYVQQQTNQGLTGDALVNAIVQRLQSSYGVQPQLTLTRESVPAFVVSDNYIPNDVLTRLGTANPLAAIALPLAVAAIADIAGVPQDQLANLVTTLNQANVPVAEEVHVIRYVPVALVNSNGQFVQFVQQQVSQGVTGLALVPVVTQQLQTYYPAQLTVSAPAPQTVVVDQNFIPPAVTSRVEEVRRNPHGGPPGQIKKQLGLQTGAEVVHGEKPGRQFTPAPVPVPPVVVQREEEHGRGHGRGHERGENRPMASSAPPQQQPVVAAPPVIAAPPAAGGPPPGRGPGNAGPPGQQKDKGPGKGHGKD